jgi:dTDP-4-dehydrorhamnose 3,5-epimerase
MRFTSTPITGALVVEPEAVGDHRGLFARTFDAEEFAAQALAPVVVQCSTSYSANRDTLRGLHYQAEPHAETKLIRCVRGALFDVGVDLRPQSPTYCAWFGIELSAENRLALYLPRGVAHGFQTLVDDTEVLYQMGDRYVPDAARGVRWDDPCFGIEWPAPHAARTISDRDRDYPDFRR